MASAQVNNQKQDNVINNSSTAFYKAERIELSWEHLDIVATVPDPEQKKKNCLDAPKKESKIITNSKGVMRPGHFTAIMGPSGSGKTTLLNFLSGRLASPNLQISGNLRINGNSIQDIDEYSGKIAYVMQDDILLGTSTPREAFMFVANLRLPQLTHKERVDKVEGLLKELSLLECANTKIGNEMIRGISGGERKRTSIGVELLTEPSMLFLDEPTTGLDSSTAEQVIQLLRDLSGIKGVNVVSTIHQPSSEIFAKFQSLILLVKGNIIYQGYAEQALDYFAKQGFVCPEFSNPSDYFMKLMNQEGLMIEKIQKGIELEDDSVIQAEFDQRLKGMISSYQNSSELQQQLELRETKEVSTQHSNNVSVIIQFWLLLKRSFMTEIRNPMELKLKMMQSIVFSIACIIVFNNLGEPEDGYSAIQNRNGVLFFLVTQQAFGSIQGALASFSSERSLFLRERLNKSYSLSSYFWGKSLAEQPFQLLYPAVGVAILYYAVGLNTDDADKFPILMLTCILCYWTGNSYGLMLSILIPKLEVALSLIPVVIIPLMVLGGFFVNLNTVPDFLSWIQYISMFKWSFQAAAINEFKDVTFSCGCITPNSNNQDFQYNKLFEQNQGLYTYGDCIQIPCDPLKDHGFDQTMAESLWIQFVLGLAIRLLTILGMYLISNPKRPTLKPPTQQQQNQKQLQAQN